MTIPLTGSAGYFTKFGHLGAGLDDINALRGGSATSRVLSGANMVTRVGQLESDYGASPDISDLIDGIWASLTAFKTSQNAFLAKFQGLAGDTIQRMADDDVKLATKTNKTALTELIRQMKSSASSVQQSSPAAGAQTAQGSPTGNPVFILSVVGPDGKNLQYIFPETLTIKITGDSQSSTGTLNNEPYLVSGSAKLADTLSYLWPGGSGANLSANLVDPSGNNTLGNVLQNSDFEDFTTANDPDNWTKVTGTIGTSIKKQTTTFYRGAASLEYVGDGAELTSMYQEFNKTPTTTVDAGGTAYKIKPSTVYGFNCFLAISPSAPAAGVLEIALVDSTGTVINDDNGTANSTTQSLPALTTSFSAKNTFFRTPSVLPANGIVRLRLKLTTALSTGKSLYMDDIALTEAKDTYPGGPKIAGFSANIRVITGDTWTSAITNTYGLFQKLLERTFGMRDLGLVVPFSGSPTISDSLIT